MTDLTQDNDFHETRLTHAYGDSPEELAIIEELGRSTPSGMNADMFMQDMQHLLPRSSTDSGFSVAVEPDEPEVRSIIAAAIPTNYYGYSSLREAVNGFAETVVYETLLGPVFYEVVLLSEAANPTVPIAYRFELVEPGTIARNRERILQRVPRSIGDTVQRGRAYKDVSAARLKEIRLTDTMYEQLALAWPLWRAADARPGMGPYLEPGRWPTGFSIEKQQRESSRVVLANTREIGWAGRSLFLEAALEPYRLARELAFVRFKREVRDVLLDGLASLVALGGAALGTAHNVRFNGLATVAEASQALDALQAGTSSIAELHRIWE